MRATALALVAGLIAPAFAGTYNTVMQQSLAGDQMLCNVSNVGASPVDVTVMYFDQSGGAVAAAADNCAALGGILAPGQSCNAVLTGFHFARCTVHSSSSKVRAALDVLDGTGRVQVSVPATKK